MDVPAWERREEWALAEVGCWLDRGLQPRPILLLFEDDEATLYVRGALRPAPQLDQQLAWSELFALGWALTPEAALVVTPVRVRTDADGALAGEAEGGAGIGMEWMRRRHDGAPEHGGVVHTYGIDDAGDVIRRDRVELPDDDGPLRDQLTAVVTGRWPAGAGGGAVGGGPEADLGLPPASLAYSLRAFGLTIGVADGWFARYGFDAPVDPRHVRPEDRQRARAWRSHRRGRTEVAR
ncbi:MAG: hypothetical protein KY461_07850 [Actinobacteria bacterium]|nr:hypothetical protein [Actinomycetota bacterium]